MVETLRKRGGAVWYVEAEDEGHGMTRPQNMFYTEAAISKFVETYLLKP
jgi:dipeptidyl aminopeptidase/acylaminoacyl peptidase